MKIKLIVAVVIASAILTGCSSSSKTVWDAQGCAYTITTYVSNPSTPDDWTKVTFTAGPGGMSRNRMADKSTCLSKTGSP